MMENYLKSALDAQGTYHDTVARCLHVLVGDVFKARPALQRIQVELDYTSNPPYSSTYTIRGIMIDLGIGWIELPTVYAEDVGKIVQYVYTHSHAITATKGVGMLTWSRCTYYPLESNGYVPNTQPVHTNLSL